MEKKSKMIIPWSFSPWVKKTMMYMKLTYVIFFVSILQALAGVSYSQSTKLSLDMKDATVRSVLENIEDQTEFYFLYSSKIIDVERKVNVELKEAKIDDILEALFEGSDILFKVDGRQIVLAKNIDLLRTNSEQSKISVSGKVTDSSGTPLPGVTVVVKGTTQGTITDADGNYYLSNLPDDGTLIFSFVGMKTQEFPVTGKTSINVTMVEETIGLDEVVAIGYGTIKKSDLTGSVTTVSSADFGDRSTTNIGELLQGKAAGVEVTDGKIRVRGVTTINNTNPLYVIDGFIGGDIGTIHPNDIETIEILKDASATAIYGARGANGVILIMTKKGKAGEPLVELNTYYGILSPSKYLDMLNASEYMNLLTDIQLNGGSTIADLAETKIFNPDGTPNSFSLTDRTDWQRLMLKNGSSMESTLSIRGGSSKAHYRLSSAFNNNESTQGVNFKDYKFGFAGDWLVFKDKVKLTSNMNIQYSNQQGFERSLGLAMPSYAPVEDPAEPYGYFVLTEADYFTDANNPAVNPHYISVKDKYFRIMGSLGAEIKFFKGLTLNTTLGIIGNTGYSYDYERPRQLGNIIHADAEFYESFGYTYYPKIENYLTYSFKVGQHDFNAMIGNTYENGSYGRSVNIYAKGFTSDNVVNSTVADNSSIRGNSGFHSAYLSYFGRINYILKNKYLFTFNMRADGSDKFAPANRWGYFPSVAVGWKLHEEEFLKDQNFISLLKLRLSYGLTGNDAIPQYQYFSSIHSEVTYAFPSQGFAGLNYNGATIASLASPVIKWESVKNTSIGVDLGILENKFQFSADYFHKNSYDILFAVPQPPSLGMGFDSAGGNAIVNAASVMNRGIEMSFIHKNKIGGLHYNIDANITFVKNEVTSLGNGEPYNAGKLGSYSTNRTELGFPIGYFYGYKMDKVYATQQAVDADNQAARAIVAAADPSANLNEVFYQIAETKAGDIRFVDVNGDGIVTDADRTYLGSSIPKINYGLSASAQYKNFDVFMAWSGVQGNKILNVLQSQLEGMYLGSNQLATVLDRWKSEDDPGNGIVPRAVKGDPAKNLRMSDRFIYNGSYARMKQLSIGYSMPRELIQNVFKGTISKVRFYISGDNLITISNYPGYNPEIGGDNTSRGIDGASNLADRIYRLGLSVNF